MPDTDPPNWIDSLSAALPWTDRRAIEGWAFWLSELWDDSNDAMNLLREMSNPAALADGLGPLLTHMTLMNYDLPMVEDKLRLLYESVKGEPYEDEDDAIDDAADQLKQWWPSDGLASAARDLVELRTALRSLSEAIRDFDLTAMREKPAEANRNELYDKLSLAIEVASRLRAGLDDS